MGLFRKVKGKYCDFLLKLPHQKRDLASREEQNQDHEFTPSYVTQYCSDKIEDGLPLSKVRAVSRGHVVLLGNGIVLPFIPMSHLYYYNGTRTLDNPSGTTQ
jgi:hypothetical protein